MMRIFVALALPPDVTAHLLAFVQKNEIGVGSADVRMTDPTRWHITLAFCGEVPAATAEKLAAGLRQRPLATTSKRSPLGLAGGGRFGHSTAWVGVQDSDSWLGELATLVHHRARSAGCSFDAVGRPQRWRAHVTVARARRRSTLGVDAGIATILNTYRGPTWSPKSVILFRSHLGPQPAHEPLATIHLPEAPSSPSSPASP